LTHRFNILLFFKGSNEGVVGHDSSPLKATDGIIFGELAAPYGRVMQLLLQLLQTVEENLPHHSRGMSPLSYYTNV